MTYPAVTIAKYFIEKYSTSGEITQMKLQKLVYYAHAASLAILEKPLINEKVYAWEYGPVIKELYSAFSMFGKNNIYYDNFLSSFVPASPALPEYDTETRSLLDAIWEKFGNLNGIQLSKLTHEKGEAWREIADSRPHETPKDTEIPQLKIARSFKNRFVEE